MFTITAKTFARKNRPASCQSSRPRSGRRSTARWWRRSTLQVPIGTYTGWNLFNRSFYEDGFCTLQGSFIPFARTRQERLDAGDPRLSIEERYPSKETYVAAIKKAADGLVAARYLLPEDACRLVSQAEREGVRLAP